MDGGIAWGVSGHLLLLEWRLWCLLFTNASKYVERYADVIFGGIVSDLINEIKEDLQNEKFAKLWNDYSNYLIGAILAVVIYTAGYVWWKDYKSAKYEVQGDQIYKAFIAEKNGKIEESLKTYTSLINEDGVGGAYIAALRKAAILAQSGKADAAAEIYNSLSDSGAPVEVRELSELLYLQASNISGDPKLLERLKKMANGTGPFRFSAKELLAFYNFEHSEYDASLSIFSELSKDISTPEKMRSRSGEMISVIETKKAEKNG